MRRGFARIFSGATDASAPRRAAVFCLGAASFVVVALGGEPGYQLDPFGRATYGDAACPLAKPKLLTPEEMRSEAHGRVERGTYCALEGTCEPGGAYHHDPEINAQVISAIGANPRFRNTSIWVTTSRGWVTLEGCVHSNAQRKDLLAFVAKQPKVARVFDKIRRLAK